MPETMATADLLTHRVPVLELSGASKLSRSLADAARARGLGFSTRSEPGAGSAEAPELSCLVGGKRVADRRIEPDPTLPRAIADDALGRIAAACHSADSTAAAVVLAPAAGVCGPAAAGPVDALGIGGRWSFRCAGGSGSARMLTAQQTRCWLISYSWQAAAGAADPAADGLVELVPAWVAKDTARVCEYVQDRPDGPGWSRLLQLGPAQSGPDGRTECLFAFTEALYAADLVASLLTGADR